MTAVVGLAVGLVLAGLAICWLSRQAGPTLGNLFWWAGIVLAVVGLVLLVVPPLNWLYAQLRATLAT